MSTEQKMKTIEQTQPESAADPLAETTQGVVDPLADAKTIQELAELCGLKKPKTLCAVSKAIAGLLRHGKNGFTVNESGFAPVEALIEQLLLYKGLKKQKEIIEPLLNETLIHHLVRVDNKTRYSLKKENGVWMIGANQGHSVPVEDLPLESLKPEKLAMMGPIVHAAYQQDRDAIIKGGLQKMGRTHIHMCPILETPKMLRSGGKKGAPSLFIAIDAVRAHADGIEFFMSKNGVVLCEGPIPSSYLSFLPKAEGKNKKIGCIFLNKTSAGKIRIAMCVGKRTNGEPSIYTAIKNASRVGVVPQSIRFLNWPLVKGDREVYYVAQCFETTEEFKPVKPVEAILAQMGSVGKLLQ